MGLTAPGLHLFLAGDTFKLLFEFLEFLQQLGVDFHVILLKLI